jgi:hypothetical protein
VRLGPRKPGRASAVLELIHVGRPVGLGIVKTALGLGLFGLTVLGMYLLAARSGLGVAIVGLIPAFWLVDWGSLMLVDGVSDLIARWRLGDVRPHLAMVLSPDGVRCSGRYTGAADNADLTVTWDEITGSGFRRGPGGSLWFCLDAPVPIAAPGELERAAVLRLPVEVIPRMVSAWIDSVIAGDDPPERRRLLANMFWFGTPLAVNLAICPKASPARVDQFLARHAPQGIRCVNPEGTWWRPPPASRYLSLAGATRIAANSRRSGRS